MFMISRCQTPLNPRLGWEGRAPVNKAGKRPPGPLEGPAGCGFLTAQWSLALLLHILSGCTEPSVQRQGRFWRVASRQPFQASSWVAMGKWTVFRHNQIRLRVAHPAGFIHHLSWRMFHPLPGSAGSCHPSAPHISFTNVIPLSPACLHSGYRVAVSQKHQAVVAYDGPWFLGFCLRAPFMLFE